MGSLTEAFPAVTVPFSLKIEGRVAILSSDTSLGCSSVVNSSVLPFFPFTSTSVSSEVKTPSALAGRGGEGRGGREGRRREGEREGGRRREGKEGGGGREGREGGGGREEKRGEGRREGREGRREGGKERGGKELKEGISNLQGGGLRERRGKGLHCSIIKSY